MANHLILAESGQKARTIGAIVRQLDPGNSWHSFATGNAIAHLPPDKLGVERGTFSLQWQYEGKRYFNKFFQAVVPATTVWIATNPDPAGELRASQIKRAIEDRIPDKPIRRLWLPELTVPAIQRRLENSDEVDDTLATTEEARIVIERWLRFELSEFVQASTGTGATIGISTAVLLKLFGTDRQWAVEATLSNGTVVRLPGFTFDQANAVANQLTFLGWTSSPATEQPPEPFNTWTFLEAGYRVLGQTAPELMAAADALYDTGVITYPRTFSTWIPAAAAEVIRDYIESVVGKGYRGVEERQPLRSLGPYYTEAVRPTSIDTDPTKVHPSNRDVYRLIWARTMASQSVPAEGRNVKLLLLSGDKIESNYFDVQTPGYRRLGMGLLGPLEPFDQPGGDRIPAKVVPIANDGLVASTMAREGIGSPGQAVSAVGYLLKERLVTRAHGGLVATQRGIAIATILRDRLPDLTADVLVALQRDLDKIARQDGDRTMVLSRYDKLTRTVVAAAPRSLFQAKGQCPGCGQVLQVVFYGGEPILRCPSVAPDSPFGDGCSQRFLIDFDTQDYPSIAVKQLQDVDDTRNGQHPSDLRPAGG